MQWFLGKGHSQALLRLFSIAGCAGGMPYALCLIRVRMQQLQVLFSVNVLRAESRPQQFLLSFSPCTCARLLHAYSVAGHCTFCSRSTACIAVGCAACRPAYVCACLAPVRAERCVTDCTYTYMQGLQGCVLWQPSTAAAGCSDAATCCCWADLAPPGVCVASCSLQCTFQ
jgi:hypothetical protein